MDRDQRCTVCGQTLGWHQDHSPQHMFQAEGGPLEVPKPKESAPPPIMRGDLALRLALLKKGLLSEFELAQAEEWMHQASLRGQAVTIEPDIEAGGYRFRLLSMEDLIAQAPGARSEEVRSAYAPASD
jgi:hypothetical protein